MYGDGMLVSGKFVLKKGAIAVTAGLLLIPVFTSLPPSTHRSFTDCIAATVLVR
jgi:hypothetical protein